MKSLIAILKEKPLTTCILAWLLVPGMYLVVGILTGFLDIKVQTAFMIASPIGLSGFIFWCLTLIFSIKKLRQGRNIASSIIALLGAILPLAFIGIGLWITILRGGV